MRCERGRRPHGRQLRALAEGERAGFVDDLKDIGRGFLSATWRALEAVPGVIGIHIGDGEDGAEWTALLGSVRGLFETSSGGHGALAGLAFSC